MHQRPIFLKRQTSWHLPNVKELGDAGIKFDVEGSGYGFRVIKTIASDKAAMATTCKMVRP
jgi:branched-chain amino acid transport system substrate-binding protein